MLHALDALGSNGPVLPTPTPWIVPTATPGGPGGVYAQSLETLWGRTQVSTYPITAPSNSIDSAFRRFADEGLEVLAGLRPRLLTDAEALPGSRILDGQFTAVQQAVGTARRNEAGAAFLRDFVEEAKASGLVARLIERHHVRGLSIAPPA